MSTLAGQVAIAIAGQLLFSLFQPKQPDQFGPRLSDLNVPAVSPGNPICRAWGSAKVPGQTIWTSGLLETTHTQKIKGGKGGGRSSTSTTYTYSTCIAVALTDGEILRVDRIYAGDKLLWSNPNGVGSLDDQLAAYTAERTTYWTNAFNSFPLNEAYTTADAKTAGINAKVAADVAAWKTTNQYGTDTSSDYVAIKVYTGSETQTADPTMESYLGVGNVPAYRGTSYFVIDTLQLANYGNAMPQFTAEVVTADGKVSLTTILTDLCTNAGLVSGDSFMVSPELANMQLDGFVLTQATSARGAVTALQNVFPFDGVELGDYILFQTRDRIATATINSSDLRTYQSGSTPPNKIERTRIDDLQLPRRINLGFQDVNRQFSSNTAFAMRQFSQSQQVVTNDLTVASDAETMKKAAETLMALTIAQRTTYHFFLPVKYLAMQLGDIVRLPMVDGTYREVRITQRDLGANFILDCMAQEHVLSKVDISARAETAVIPPATVSPTANTDAVILDSASLDDTDISGGVYAALCPSTDNWPGGGLYRDINSGVISSAYGTTVVAADGTDWTLQFSSGEISYLGVASKALKNISPDMVDWESTLTVLFTTPGAFFSSQTLDQATRGSANVFLVGNEIVQALNVAYLADDVWQFTGLIRGIRGTDYAIPGHQDTEQVVTLDTTALTRWSLADALIGTTIDYRTTTMGQDVVAQTTKSFAYEGNYRKCFAPAVIDAVRASDGALSFALDPRARYGGFWESGAGTASTETTETFTIEVYDRPAYQAGAVLLRTATLVGSRDWTYTAADQTTDFGAVQSAVNLRVTQTSDAGVEGFPRYAAV